MSKLNILVVGASIAGPMSAYWLAKAGAKVTIIERFPTLRTAGQNIDIRTSGVTVMRKIPGMEAAVRAKTAQMEGISFVNDSGKSFGSIKPTGNPDQQSLISEYEIYRGDLAQILFDLTKSNKNINYIFGEQIASMHQQSEKEADGPISVEFTNGSPASQYDLVVACDGATSRTRAMGLNCGVRDHIHPTNCWAAYFSIKQDLLKGDPIGKGFSAPGGRFIGCGPGPSGRNKITMMCMNPRTNRNATLSFREAAKHGDGALKKFVARHYAGAGWKTDEIIQGMVETDDFYANEVVQVKLPSLYKGRFALVGDAGYAPGLTGTGTTLAMTGAYILAGEIVKHGNDLTAALNDYEQVMKPIIKDMQKQPPILGAFVAPQTAGGIWIRNNVFAFLAWTGILEFLPRFFASAFASSDKYGLPDYKWVA